MRLIQRYLFRQLLGHTLVATAALTGVAVLTASLEALDVLVNDRQSLVIFAEITLLVTPQIIAMILPLAICIAGLVGLNRLHTEQEIVICFAGGMSRWRVAAPAIRLATFVTLAHLVINLWIQPLCFREMREVLMAVKADIATTMIRPGEFTHPGPGLTVFAQSMDESGDIKNLFINRASTHGKIRHVHGGPGPDHQAGRRACAGAPQRLSPAILQEGRSSGRHVRRVPAGPATFPRHRGAADLRPPVRPLSARAVLPGPQQPWERGQPQEAAVGRQPAAGDPSLRSRFHGARFGRGAGRRLQPARLRRAHRRGGGVRGRDPRAGLRRRRAQRRRRVGQRAAVRDPARLLRSLHAHRAAPASGARAAARCPPAPAQPLGARPDGTGRPHRGLRARPHAPAACLPPWRSSLRW